MKKENKQSFKRILSNNFLMIKYIGKCVPGLIVWIIVLRIIVGITTTLNAVYVAKLVLDAVQNNTPFTEILPVLIVVLLLNLITAVLSGYYNGSYYERMTSKLCASMHEELLTKARAMELACYDNPEFYNDFVWAMSESHQKALAVLDSFGSLVSALTTVVSSAAIVLSVDSIGIWVEVIVLGSFELVRRKVIKLGYESSLVQKPLQRKRDYGSRIFYQPEYAKELRLTPVEEKLVDNFQKDNNALIATIRKFGKKVLLYRSLSMVFIEKLLIYGFYVAYLLYCTLVLKIYSLGDFYTLFSGTGTIATNWDALFYSLSNLQNHSLYIEKFRTFIEYQPKMASPENPVEVPDKPVVLSLNNVSFTYDGMEEATLKDINLSIHPGEKIALVGYNGAGKTTLIKLIMRLYDVSSGKICLGGVNIKDFDLEEFRKYFGVVFQDYQLLATTIGENVMMDLIKEGDEAKILDALTKSGFEDKLATLEHGINTCLSREFDKDGVNLSGGEGQKVAIARVFSKDCKMVILDEPSSALDPISEYNVNQSMLEAAKDKTVIFISHRLSTTRVADRIIMLEKGRIIEEGSHEELMKKDGKYAQMFNLQAEKYQ